MFKKEFSFELVTRWFCKIGKNKFSARDNRYTCLYAVGTQGTVKGVFTDDILKTNTQALRNTYHLLLRPGINKLKQFWGLHEYMNWKNQYWPLRRLSNYVFIKI